MVNYNLAGFYDLETEAGVERIAVAGNLRADEARLASTYSSNITGNLRYNLPRVSGAQIMGWASICSSSSRITFFLRPRSEDYLPSIFLLNRESSGRGLEGEYKGTWGMIAKELMDELPEDPTARDLANMHWESVNKFGMSSMGAEITLMTGKIAKLRRAIGDAVDRVSEILSPEPQPERIRY